MSALPSSPSTGIRDLQQTLARAADARLAEVVSLVDAMPHRGAADALLAPLRGRLLQLRPQRPIQLTRLMFTPADPVIVPATAWRRGGPTIPRSALACLAAQLRALLAVHIPCFEAEIAGLQGRDRYAVQACGGRLWPMLADCLASAPPPQDWTAATGLPTSDHAAIAQPLAFVLRQGQPIDALVQLGLRSSEALAAPLLACVTAATEMLHGMTPACSAQVAGTLAAVLLARLPVPGQVITVLGDLAHSQSNPALRLGVDLAIAFILDDAAQAQNRQLDLPTAAADLARLAGLLDTLDRPGPSGRPGSKARVAELRRTTDIDCRARFQTEIAEGLLKNANSLGAEADEDAVHEVEHAALDLRRFEAAGRRFGGGAHYDRMLAEAVRSLVAVAPSETPAMDLARLIEILQGPDAALAHLARAPGPRRRERDDFG